MFSPGELRKFSEEYKKCELAKHVRINHQVVLSEGVDL